MTVGEPLALGNGPRRGSERHELLLARPEALTG
jgi:hypothetical protein